MNIIKKISLIGIVAVIILQGYLITKQYEAVLRLLSTKESQLGRGDFIVPSFKATTVSAVSVTTSSTLVQATSSRPYMAIVNNGDYPVYLALNGDAPAVVNEGIRINPGGGSYEILADENPYNGAIRAIASGGTSVITVTSY